MLAGEKNYLYLWTGHLRHGESELFSWVQKGTDILPPNMLFFVAASAKAGWLLKCAHGSTTPSWIISAVTLLCHLFVLTAFTPKVKIPNTFKDLVASAELMVHFHCFQWFLIGLELPQIDTGERKSLVITDLCLNWDHFPAPRSPACLAKPVAIAQWDWHTSMLLASWFLCDGNLRAYSIRRERSCGSLHQVPAWIIRAVWPRAMQVANTPESISVVKESFSNNSLNLSVVLQASNFFHLLEAYQRKLNGADKGGMAGSQVTVQQGICTGSLPADGFPWTQWIRMEIICKPLLLRRCLFLF